MIHHVAFAVIILSTHLLNSGCTKLKNELIVRTTDSNARISLPKGFANVTVLVEQVSDSEVRIKKVEIVPC